MELKDVLKAKQLSLTFFVVLNTLEVPTSMTCLALWLELGSEFPT